MPTKIGYQVVGNSGEAEGHDAKYLERHGPTVPGWQTPRYVCISDTISYKIHIFKGNCINFVCRCINSKRETLEAFKHKT